MFFKQRMMKILKISIKNVKNLIKDKNDKTKNNVVGIIFN